MSDLEKVIAEIESLSDVAVKEQLRSSLNQFIRNLRDNNQQFPANPPFQSSIVKVWASSLFVRNCCVIEPDTILELIATKELFISDLKSVYLGDLYTFSVNSETALMTILRQFRKKHMIRIAWRDIAGWSDLSETLLDLSALADACIEYALDFLYQAACKMKSSPILPSGCKQQLIVLGMGKLGAKELNFSSDIDLIFTYPEEGILEDKKKTSYSEFFSKLCTSLIKVLNEATVEGFVFRVDTRLRPFGASGPIVMNFQAMENYYQTQAREWERYAMVKVRPVAGDLETAKQLMQMLNPFVYRRYLDYGAFEELRTLKLKITQELMRKDKVENIKLGPGGIREIEFIVQAFQLIRGGQNKELQESNVLKVLPRLGELNLLTKEDIDTLERSYMLLRQVENHIQAYQDKQTHDLPEQITEKFALAVSLNYSSWISFKEHIDEIRNDVHQIFEEVFSLTKEDKENNSSNKVWSQLHTDDTEALEMEITSLGFHNPQQVIRQLFVFQNALNVKKLTKKGAETLDRLIPKLLSEFVLIENADETLGRILNLFEAIAGRNVYYALLIENPSALTQLVKLSSSSFWICDYLALHPILLDELLDSESLYSPLSKPHLEEAINSQMALIEKDQIEQVMTSLRQFKQSNVLRVASADIAGVIPLMVVSDYLTYIAEEIVKFVVGIAWRILEKKHGLPQQANEKEMKFAVIAYGKFGGIELGYGSDLDLVFLSDTVDQHGVTSGDKPVTCLEFYAKLGQKISSILNTKMFSGVLYEVDLRLRPSGNAGLLVSQVGAFQEYLDKSAWTWEHQALVRARFVAGDIAVGEKFHDIRKAILIKSRKYDDLKQEVREMRKKMADNFAVKAVGRFDLKHSPGGIADIEFIVQFCVLAYAHKTEKLIDFTDNIRIMASLRENGYISEYQLDTLHNAYCAYRDRGHRETLQGSTNVIAESIFADIRPKVKQIWSEIMSSHQP